MAQLALAQMATGLVDEEEEFPEPVADQNLNRRKVLDLQHEINQLQKLSLKHHEAVTHLETGLKTMISEVHLRRALGLAFQEFENRIEDAFQDSNRKCLSMFSKREDVIELQTLVTKKVNWAEYNAVLKKLADLRQYVDGMAETVFIGQREALESEFAKKANADWVEKALGEKAEFTDLNDVRARLERLEVLVAHNDQKHSSKLQAMREETAAKNDEIYQNLEIESSGSQTNRAPFADDRCRAHWLPCQLLKGVRQHALMKEANGTMTSNKQSVQDMKTMIERHEARLKQTDSSLLEMSKAQQEMAQLAGKTLLPRIEQMEDWLQRKDQARDELLRQLEGQADELKGAVSVVEMGRQGEQFREQLEFLMQATEMLKRRLREMSKHQNGKMKEISDDQGRQVQQLAALERVMKRQDRETRAELRSMTATGDSWRAPTGGGHGLPMLPAEEDPNVRLTGVLQQLQKIAGGGFSEQSTHVGSFFPSRGAATDDWGDAADSLGRPTPAMAATSGVRGMYGLSPRSAWPERAEKVPLRQAGYAAAHLTLLGVGLYVDVALTQWNGVFWTALQNHQSKQFYRLLWDFVIITGVTGFVGTYNDYLSGMWHLHARDHLTRHFNQLWVSNGAMCMMRQSSIQVDNPDQRIDRDVDEFVGSTRELFFGGLGSIVRLGIYFPILLRSAPAPLLGFVLVWPIFGALMTHGLGRRLIPLSLAGESANADFRSELVFAREKADSLALMGAGPHLAENLQERFEVMKRVAYAEFDVTKFLNFFKMMYEEYGTVVPFVLLAPAYFSGALDLGKLMQLRMIVERVSQSLTFPVAAYEQAVGWRVAANRLAALAAATSAVAPPSSDSPSAPGLGSPSVLRVEGVDLKTPQGRLLLENVNLEVSPGERLLLVLPASGGKSLPFGPESAMRQENGGEAPSRRKGRGTSPIVPHRKVQYQVLFLKSASLCVWCMDYSHTMLGLCWSLCWNPCWNPWP
ncbi:unnamed protein product [Durusdinium trenchii]|uniref:ABC transmembrane type-1 domain-containing protein n=1 Tax=Durusdinium trenchii TaxID=1381693 RepID=A0ABP0STT5_9DINO